MGLVRTFERKKPYGKPRLRWLFAGKCGIIRYSMLPNINIWIKKISRMTQNNNPELLKREKNQYIWNGMMDVGEY
jgi:hypothetical protein